jgi:hypothetical protein
VTLIFGACSSSVGMNVLLPESPYRITIRLTVTVTFLSPDCYSISNRVESGRLSSHSWSGPARNPTPQPSYLHPLLYPFPPPPSPHLSLLLSSSYQFFSVSQSMPGCACAGTPCTRTRYRHVFSDPQLDLTLSTTFLTQSSS